MRGPYDLSREIVWDALVDSDSDSDLVSGWLRGAGIEPRTEGGFNLERRQFQLLLHIQGEVVELIEPRCTSESRGTWALYPAPPGCARGSRDRWELNLIVTPPHGRDPSRVFARYVKGESRVIGSALARPPGRLMDVAPRQRRGVGSDGRE